ncbi:MAG: tripartite tricarboxylate transporter substrate binding protein [Oceanicaulis sp.]|nr:tripartite tricarboxylate transporter substrate binding protein [Oceanicaulis sp.]
MRLLTGVLCLSLGASIAVGTAGESKADEKPENYLTRQFTFVVPYGPGGLTDARGRAFQPVLEEILGVPVVVQNISGAGALVGINYTFSRPSDGTHIVTASGSDGPHAHSVLSDSNLAWEWEDWTPVGEYARSVLGFVALRGGDWDSLEEMIEHVRENPGEVTLASIGPGRADDLYMLEFMQASDTLGKWNWVTYSGSGAIQTDLLSGDIDVGYLGVSRADMLDHPNFVVLAQGIKESEVPDDWEFPWPTVEAVVGQELGLIGASYAAIFVKADTDPDRVEFLKWAFEEAATHPEFIRIRNEFGEPALWNDGETARERLTEMHELLKEYKPLLQEHGQQ